MTIVIAPLTPVVCTGLCGASGRCWLLRTSGASPESGQGATLAKQEGEVAFGKLLAHYPEISLGVEPER
ncbi:hypothetical protein ACFVJH_28675, partial [Streptomyces decoyicus]|uniref:hypothetical protein n=1 Tax=Streptomyces decoyicus TaxID=249567 RepID=UPI00362CAB0D